MSLEIKYTTDGKKVAVLGNLNSQEKIVQEIFITNGLEIPSGDNFVVKSLHDAPVVSWKEEEVKKLEAKYAADKKKYSDLISNLEKTYYSRSSELKLKLEYFGNVLKNVSPESFELLTDWVCGNVKYVLVDHYSELGLYPIEEFNQMYENKLRLFSIFGKDDGTFTYARNDYYDYSGGNKKFHPIRTLEEGLTKLKEIILSINPTKTTIAVAEKYNIQLPKEMVEKYIKEQVKCYENSIISNQENITKNEAEIKKIYDKYS